jgi:GDP-4-dehydro-6-deoxy-D-mannose reductase
MRILITGVTGFAGSHLADLALTKPGVEVWGACRWRSPLENVEHLQGHPKFFLLNGDMTDPAAVRLILEESKPDYVFHLAAQSYVPASFTEPRETFHTNVLSEINLLHGVREKLAGGMMVAGSSEEYGFVHPAETPITEEQPLRPLSPYAVSKVAQDLLAYQYHKSYGLNVVRARAFNHEGPRRGHVFVMSNWAKQIAEIEAAGKRAEIYHGNLDAVRDFGDVRDTVRAYWAMMEKGQPGEVYNVATGQGTSMRALMDMLLNLSTVKDITEVADPTRLRPSDVPILVGESKKLRKRTGWMPEFTLAQTVRDTIEYWRDRTKKNLARQEKVM